MQPILPLAEPFELTKGTKALQKKLNERIDKHNQNVEAFETERKRIEDASVEDIAERGFAAIADVMPRERIDLLSEEFKIRRDLADYFELRARDLEAAITAAGQKKLALRAELREKFLSIGFEDVFVVGLGVRDMPPILYFEHPHHKAAVQELLALEGTRAPSPQEAANREALPRLQEEIEGVRRRMLAKANA
jgi:hypothetical protein